MSDEPGTRVLSARLENVRLLSDALSCMYSSAHKSQDVLLSVPPKGGLKFAVEQAGCLHASVLLPLTSFAQFSCSDATCRVRLNLSLLLDCINIFSGNSDRGPFPVRVSYDGVGHPLILLFQEQDQEAVTTCRLNTIDNEYAAEMETDFMFRREDVKNMALLESEPLRDAIAELDYAGATTADLRLAPTVPRFRFQSPAMTFRVPDADTLERQDRFKNGTPAQDGFKRRRSSRAGDQDSSADGTDDAEAGYDNDDAGSDVEGVGEAQCAIDLPDPEDRSLAVFHEFRSEVAQTSSYRLDLLSRCSKALSMSETSKVQMNSNGMLSIVCRMRPGMASSSVMASERRPASGGNDHCFTEFLIVADEIEDMDIDGDEG